MFHGENWLWMENSEISKKIEYILEYGLEYVNYHKEKK